MPQYEYDLFISYSHKDQQWVLGELLPRLDAWGFRNCIDVRDLAPGPQVADELARLIRRSRQTLIVLTENWLASNYGDYEMQLKLYANEEEDSQRFVPLRAADVQPRGPLQEYQVIDALQLGWNATWGVLRQTLLGARGVEMAVLAAELDLSKNVTANDRPWGFDYEAALLVANLHPEARAFDSIELVFTGRDPEGDFDGCVQAIRVEVTKNGVRTQDAYHGPEYFESLRRFDAQNTPAEIVELQPSEAIRLHHVSFGRSPFSRAGKNVVGLSVRLMMAGLPMTGRCHCVLPPLLRLPDFRSNDRFHILLRPELDIPSPSGLFDPGILNVALDTAAAHDPESLLLELRPHNVIDIQYQDGSKTHTCNSWFFTFISGRDLSLFTIETADPAWATDRKTGTKPESWLSRAILERTRIDCRTAYLMAVTVGAQAGPEPLAMGFCSTILDGCWRPLWRLPLELDARHVGVLADTCEIVTESQPGMWRKADGVIWNS